MTEAEKPQWFDLVHGTAQLKGRNLDGNGIEMYWKLTKHLSLKDFEAGLLAAAKHSQFFPQPHEVIDAIPPSTEAWRPRSESEDSETVHCRSCLDIGFILRERPDGTTGSSNCHCTRRSNRRPQAEGWRGEDWKAR